MKLLRYITLILCLCLGLSSAAQRRIAVAPVGKAFHDGFHQILMDPIHRSIANPDLSNVKLMDLSGKEIPYVIRKHGSVPIKDITHTRVEGEATTVTNMHFDCPYPVEIEHIRFNILSPMVFQRRVFILSDGPTGLFFNEIFFKPRADSIYSFSVPMYTSSFGIDIENLDAPPLEIRDIQFFQPGTFIVADLKIADDYELVYFDSTTKAPNYNLGSSAGQISDELDLLKPGELKLLSSTSSSAEMPEPKPSFWETTWFMWLCIVAIAVIIVVVGGRMVRDMRERKSEEERESEEWNEDEEVN